MRTFSFSLALSLVLTAATASAQSVPIVNPSFEIPPLGSDGNYSILSGPQAGFGWTAYNPGSLSVDWGCYDEQQPTDGPYYGGVAPDGDNIGYTWHNISTPDGTAFGIQQTLGTTLSPSSTYTLRVMVGNVAGTISGANLTGFPGYRVELIAGSTVLATDNNSLAIAEDSFEESVVVFVTGPAHAELGQPLGIRLLHLNGGAGIEVDFDDVRLEACSADLDGDGFGSCAGDCDDSDDTIFPGSPELCDGIDNDCDGTADSFATTCGVGACAAAGQCLSGADTCSPGSPSAELCDGFDNDCDGTPDEGNPGGGSACDTGDSGVCAAGTTACLGGSVICLADSAPSAELCDGLDNDCDGTPDDGNPGGGAVCGTGQAGVCSPGTTACSAGSLVCNADNAPSAELCDGLDNDCDGSPDEGDPGGGNLCDTGLLGLCAAGVTACQAGSIGCLQQVGPGAEICDGLDNDCDGAPDEGDPGGGSLCDTGLVGVCAAGVTACQAGSIGCLQQVGPGAEICDGLDNDCDGTPDEGDPGGGASCDTGLPGVCSAGTEACVAGALDCFQDVAPSAETCLNGLDDDCDGDADLDDGDCSPPTAIAELRSLVESLVPVGDQGGLVAKLDAIVAKLDRGQTRPACNQLNAFVNQLESFFDDGLLTEAEMNTLVDAANAIGLALGCSNAPF